MILFPKANQAELASAGSSFPLILSGERPGWGLLTCSDVVSLPPKAATQKFSEANSPGGRRLVVPSWLKREQCAQFRFTVPKSHSTHVKMGVSPYLLIKRTQIPPRLLVFWGCVCERVASLAQPVGVWQLSEQALHG